MKQFVPRVLYELELGNYCNNLTSNNTSLKLISSHIISNQSSEDDGHPNYSYNNYLIEEEKDKEKILSSVFSPYSLKRYSSKNVFNKYYNKACGNYNVDENAKESTFFGKVFWVGSSSFGASMLKSIKTDAFLTFTKVNKVINNIEMFDLTYVLQTLKINLNLLRVNELLNYDSSTMKQSNNIHWFIRKANKNFLGWRPLGQIMTTLYDHNKAPVEKIISLSEDKFASFDSTGNAILWKAKKSDEDCFNFTKIWSSKLKHDKKILYNKTILNMDNIYLIFGSRNSLYKYCPEMTSNHSKLCSKLCSTEDEGNVTCSHLIEQGDKDNKQLLFCSDKGRIHLYDPRTKDIDMSTNISPYLGVVSCICNNFNNHQFFLGTYGGYILDYDLRLNSITETRKYSDNTPIINLSLFYASKSNIFDLDSILKSSENSKYLIINSGADDHEIAYYNLNLKNFDLLLKVNNINPEEVSPLTVEIPCLTETRYLTSNFDQENTLLNQALKSLRKYFSFHNNNYTQNLFGSYIQDDFYRNSSLRLSKLNNLFENPSTVQCSFTPYFGVNNSNNNCYLENCPYLISAGNDMTIRYWDITREGMNNSKSYIINAPNSLSTCEFTKSKFYQTIILQSNEVYNEPGPKKNMPGISEYQIFNGVSFHLAAQNEFDENDSVLKYCTKIADASHKSIITDIVPMNVGNNNNSNLLLSSSWDGTIKIWK